MSDEVLRRLEREVSTDGSAPTRIRLANELERRGLRDDATTVLFDALAAYPSSDDVRLALGRFRGPSTTEWCQPQGDARNTRRSSTRGPKGDGKVIERRELAPRESALFTRTQDRRVTEAEDLPPPLFGGSYVYFSIGTGRRVLAATADGHLISENFGASGFEWSANRDGHAVWRIPMQIHTDDEGEERWWSKPHAVIGPDATVFGVTSLRHLIAIEPTGSLRFDHLLPAQVTGIALDAARGRLHLTYATPAGLSTRDMKTGAELVWLSLAQAVTADNVIVCDDGRVACISHSGNVAIVSSEGNLERTMRVDEKIGGAEGALCPWGELVVVSFDPAGAGVSLFDPATGKDRGHFNAPDCRGAPAIDADGTLYLDGGARFVMGYDLKNYQPRYKLDRPTLWRTPDQPPSQFALGEGELAFIELTSEGVMLIRAGA